MAEIVLEDEVTLFSEYYKTQRMAQQGQFFNAQNQRIEKIACSPNR